MKISELFEDLGNLHALNAGHLLKLLFPGDSLTWQRTSNKMPSGLISAGSKIIPIQAARGLPDIRSAISTMPDIGGFCMYIDNVAVLLVTVHTSSHTRLAAYDHGWEDELSDVLNKPSRHMRIAYDLSKFPEAFSPDLKDQTQRFWPHSSPPNEFSSRSIGAFPFNSNAGYEGVSVEVTFLRRLVSSIVQFTKKNKLQLTAKLISYDLDAIQTRQKRREVANAEHRKNIDKEETLLQKVKRIGNGTMAKKPIIMSLLQSSKSDNKWELVEARKFIEQLLAAKVRWPELTVIQKSLITRLKSEFKEV